MQYPDIFCFKYVDTLTYKLYDQIHSNYLYIKWQKHIQLLSRFLFAIENIL